jgi:hypothetical protein
MSYPISACFFIRNNSAGFCAFESLAMVLPLVSEVVILDLESNDGTWETLQEIAKHNSKVQLHRKPWPHIDAGVFADLANELVAMCHYPQVWYFQADEIPHEKLIPLIRQRFERNEFELAFWRVQYKENWQGVRWFPHLVHRVGIEGQFNFVGDGMTTDRTWDARICSDYGGEMFPKWGQLGEEGIKPYVGQMLMDVSQLGGFRDNIIERRALHAPFWHETANIEGLPPNEWAERAMNNPNWTKTESPFDLPAIMRHHVGKVRYELRSELLEALKADKTAEYLEELTGNWK